MGITVEISNLSTLSACVAKCFSTAGRCLLSIGQFGASLPRACGFGAFAAFWDVLLQWVSDTLFVIRLESDVWLIEKNMSFV